MSAVKGRWTARWRPLLAAALVILFFILSVSISLRKSNTWDEPAHIMAGFAYLTEGMDFLSPLNHPVGGRALAAALPAALLDLSFDANVKAEQARGSNFFPYSVRFLYENSSPGGTVLFLSRLANIMLASALALYVFAWSRRLWGAPGAFLSLFLFVLSPDMLAHSGLATTDMPVAAFSFMAAYYLWRLSGEGARLTLSVPAAVAFALALASKHTALLMLPFVAAAFIAASRRDKRAAAVNLAVFAIAAYALLWAVYGFRFHSASPGYAGLDWGAVSGSAAYPVIDALRSMRLLPESYLYGLAGSLSGAGSGRAAFLMGEISGTGWWHYFLTAFALKTPIPLLVLLAAAFAYSLPERERLKKALWVIIPALAVFLAFSLQKVNIGLRHVLPAYPFIFVLIGLVPSITTRSAKAARAVFYACLVWYAYSASVIYPHQLAYFNEIAGGPSGGARHLVDSNLDWGQDLKGLKEYMDEKGIGRVKLAYFGLANPAHFGIEYDYLPSYMIIDRPPAAGPLDTTGYYAVSATLLAGLYVPGDIYKPLRSLEPVYRVGYSIYVYKLD